MIETSTATEADTARRQFITFTVGDGEYAVDILAVREIRRWAETTPVPSAPPWVRGVINLRGTIVPIFDLRARFGQGATQPTAFHVVIVLRMGSRLAGGLVDAVSDILDIEPRAISAAPDLERLPAERFLDGVITWENRMIALLRPECLFDLTL